MLRLVLVAKLYFGRCLTTDGTAGGWDFGGPNVESCSSGRNAGVMEDGTVVEQR